MQILSKSDYISPISKTAVRCGRPPFWIFKVWNLWHSIWWLWLLPDFVFVLIYRLWSAGRRLVYFWRVYIIIFKRTY